MSCSAIVWKSPWLSKGGGELSSCMCPRVGNTPPGKKKIAYLKGMPMHQSIAKPMGHHQHNVTSKVTLYYHCFEILQETMGYSRVLSKMCDCQPLNIDMLKIRKRIVA